MTDRLVFIPCRLNRRDARSALIEDADGWPRKVVSPMGRVDGRLVVAARWLREANGRHLAWFGDGQRLWVVYGPKSVEGYIPLRSVGACQIGDLKGILSSNPVASDSPCPARSNQKP